MCNKYNVKLQQNEVRDYVHRLHATDLCHCSFPFTLWRKDKSESCASDAQQSKSHVWNARSQTVCNRFEGTFHNSERIESGVSLSFGTFGFVTFYCQSSRPQYIQLYVVCRTFRFIGCTPWSRATVSVEWKTRLICITWKMRVFMLGLDATMVSLSQNINIINKFIYPFQKCSWSVDWYHAGMCPLSLTCPAMT